MKKTLSNLYWSTAIFMGTNMVARAQVDPSAPLDILKRAKEKAANSTLNADDISTGGTNLVNVILVFAVVIGFALALWSGMSLYRASQDENSRESSPRALAGLLVGSLITVIGLVIGLIVNYSFGTTTTSGG